MSVAITHDLGVIQVPSMPHQYEEIAKRPARIGVVGRRVCETYKAIFALRLVKEALLIGF
jgi:hypothetical protein